MLKGRHYDEFRKSRSELWRALKAAAAMRGITIRQWLEEAIVEKLEREGWEREQSRRESSRGSS